MISSVPVVEQSASESLEDLRRKRRAKIDKMNVSSDSRKRSRSNDITLQRRLSGTSSVVCEPVEGQRTAAKQAHSSSMAYKYALQGLDRNFSSEVSALRMAAAKAVAEFNEPLGAQLTAPDKSDDGLESSSQPLQPTSDSQEQNNIVSIHSRNPTPASLPGAEENAIFTQQGCPPHGAKAIMGRRPRMEDAFTAVPFLLEVPVPAENGGQSDLLPPRIADSLGGDSHGTGSDQDASTHTHVSSSEGHNTVDGGRPPSGALQQPPLTYMETLHFFGVFDGHGGAEAALHCAQTLHQRIAEALSEEMDSALSIDLHKSGTEQEEGIGTASIDSAVPPNGVQDADTEMDSSHPSSDFQNTAQTSPQGHSDSPGRAEGATCNSASFESALLSAFNRTDAEFGLLDSAALVGTTAVVTLVGSRQLYIANCGDSRAVLCRAGIALPLTDDHKANREDETARVEALGGQILFWNGVRVMGVLAVSRSIGDHCMRPFVIPDPEVTILARRPDDELLLLASDGLWDVLSNQMACTLAKRCLRRARQRGASRQAAARIAATVLTRAAFDRGSRDNVTVLVVDLSTSNAEVEDAGAVRSQSMALGDHPSERTQDQNPADEHLARAESLQGHPPRP